MGMINGYFGPRLLNRHGFSEHKIDQAWIIDRGKRIDDKRIDDAFELPPVGPDRVERVKQSIQSVEIAPLAAARELSSRRLSVQPSIRLPPGSRSRRSGLAPGCARPRPP